ncbi:MAG: hypothetical protein LBQ38_02785 [Spirochaetaceae bacterium]|jgi:hypothetical protein|nr:hypothetical protein [Spirochaetaceae bacterium]
MEVYRPLRLTLFIYDCIRLLLLIGFWVILLPFLGSEAAEAGRAFPILVYAAPNALFPLMALFLWLRFPDHEAYLSLYAAGKVIAVAAGLGWLFLAMPGVEQDQLRRYVVGAWIIFLSIADTLSLAGCLLIRHRLDDAGRGLPFPGPVGARIAAEPDKRAGQATSTHTAGTTVQRFRDGGV